MFDVQGGEPFASNRAHEGPRPTFHFSIWTSSARAWTRVPRGPFSDAYFCSNATLQSSLGLTDPRLIPRLGPPLKLAKRLGRDPSAKARNRAISKQFDPHCRLTRSLHKTDARSPYYAFVSHLFSSRFLLLTVDSALYSILFYFNVHWCTISLLRSSH